MSITNVNESNQALGAPTAPGLAPVAGELAGNPSGPPPLSLVPADVGGSVPASAAPPLSQTPAISEPTVENKEQLHRRVESRLAELTAARAQLEAQDGNRERAQAIETELQVARGAMSGGWERIGQMEAAQLSQWLAKTEQLTLEKTAAPAAPQ